MKRLWPAALLLVLACAVANAETGIQEVLRVAEARYHVRHRQVPGLALAKPFLLGSGVGHLNLALFPSVHPAAGDLHAVAADIDRTLGSEWSRFADVQSKQRGKSTVIYVRTGGRDMKMLIVTSEHERGLVVMQMTLSGKAQREWIDNTVAMAKKNNPAALR